MNRSPRSNSSAPIRAHLKENFGSAVPDISSTIALMSYLKYSKILYESAIQAYKAGDMRRAYVDLYRFQILAIQKIPSHKDYKAKSQATASAKAWLEKTKAPALDLLEEIVYQLDREEDDRLTGLKELELIDELEDPSPEPLHRQHSGYSDNSTDAGPPQSAASAELSRRLADLSILSTPAVAGAGPVSGPAASTRPVVQYSVPDIEYPEGTPESREPQLGSGRAEAAILKHLGNYHRYGLLATTFVFTDLHLCLSNLHRRRFNIPQPSTTTIDVKLGARHYFFLQDDFLTSYSGFLSMLPPELQLSQSATEMNRCFFIHLGIAVGIHPFALQCAFRSLAAAFLETAEDWEKDIVTSVQQYCGFVDANMLCFLWPAELNAYRVCFVSGPLDRPLISCFQPPLSVTGGLVEQLTEIIIRCSGDHFTLLRPLHQDQGGQQPSGGYRVISKLIEQGRAEKLVVQVSDARETKLGTTVPSINATLAKLAQGERA